MSPPFEHPWAMEEVGWEWVLVVMVVVACSLILPLVVRHRDTVPAYMPTVVATTCPTEIVGPNPEAFETSVATVALAEAAASAVFVPFAASVALAAFLAFAASVALAVTVAFDATVASDSWLPVVLVTPLLLHQHL